MIKKFTSVAGVVHALGDQAEGRKTCMQCMRPNSVVYPYAGLKMCAACVVVQSGGLDQG